MLCSLIYIIILIYNYIINADIYPTEIHENSVTALIMEGCFAILWNLGDKFEGEYFCCPDIRWREEMKTHQRGHSTKITSIMTSSWKGTFQFHLFMTSQCSIHMKCKYGSDVAGVDIPRNFAYINEKEKKRGKERQFWKLQPENLSSMNSV